jgi:predicted enzyme related to lactoylglutathione lyase
MASPFVWYDLMTTDLEGARRFYGDVLGWTARDAGMPNPYWLLLAGERPIGGAMQLTSEMISGGGRPSWMGHVGVDDVEASAAQVTALGGAIHRPPTDIPGVGRFAIAADPLGAIFSLFEPTAAYRASAPPPPAPDAPGCPGWRELLSTDWEKAWDFYSALFGWTKDTAFDMGPMGLYQLFRTGGDAAEGGMFNKPPEIPAVFWLYYFNVSGCAAAAERVKAAGGKVMMGPHEVPGGSWIINCTDPQGAMFSLVSRQA